MVGGSDIECQAGQFRGRADHIAATGQHGTFHAGLGMVEMRAGNPPPELFGVPVRGDIRWRRESGADGGQIVAVAGVGSTR